MQSLHTLVWITRIDLFLHSFIAKLRRVIKLGFKWVFKMKYYFAYGLLYGHFQL